MDSPLINLLFDNPDIASKLEICMDLFQLLVWIFFILFFCYYGFVILRRLGIFTKITKKKTVTTQYCSFCKKETPNPSVCEFCHQKFCREHLHPFYHMCKESSDRYPLHENCSFPGCGKREYLPHRCPYCQKIFCDEHFHTFNHNCEKYDKEKELHKDSGVVTVSRNGKIFVKE